MLGDRGPHARQLQQNGVWQHGFRACPTSDLLDPAAGTRPDLHLPPPVLPLHDLPAVARIAENKTVRSDQTADQGLAETGAGLDDRFVARASDRIRGEHHTGHVRGNHALHDDGELHRDLRESVLLAVGDGPVAPERRPAAADGVEQGAFAAHPQECLLLAGERSLRQVLGGRTRADGDGSFAHAAIGIEDGPFHVRRDHRLFEPGPNQGGAAGVGLIDDVAFEVVARHHELVCGGGDDEPWRNRESSARTIRPGWRLCRRPGSRSRTPSRARSTTRADPSLGCHSLSPLKAVTGLAIGTSVDRRRGRPRGVALNSQSGAERLGWR